MESDSVRSSGDSVVVDMWIDGRLRAICVSREAIEGFLHLTPARATEMSDEDRREFVRTHLAQVVTAATKQLRSKDPNADCVTIGPGQLGGSTSAASGDRSRGERRRGDRRQGGDRRKRNLGPPPSGERRH
jgi:hypothetical protein